MKAVRCVCERFLAYTQRFVHICTERFAHIYTKVCSFRFQCVRDGTHALDHDLSALQVLAWLHTGPGTQASRDEDTDDAIQRKLSCASHAQLVDEMFSSTRIHKCTDKKI